MREAGFSLDFRIRQQLREAKLPKETGPEDGAEKGPDMDGPDRMA